MVEKEIVICDICGDRVGKSKCNFCGGDICHYRSCIRTFSLLIQGGSESDVRGKIIEIFYCRDCWDKKVKNLLDKDDFWDDTFLKELSKSIGSYITKRIILEKL